MRYKESLMFSCFCGALHITSHEGALTRGMMMMTALGLRLKLLATIIECYAQLQLKHEMISKL